MIRYLIVFVVTILAISGPAWSDDTDHEAGRYQVIPDAMVPGSGGKLQQQTILLDTATGRTWTLAPKAGADKRQRANWMPIPVTDFDTQEASASPARELPNAEPRGSSAQEQGGGGGSRDRLWNYERDP